MTGGGRGARGQRCRGERCPILCRPPSQGDISPPKGALAPEEQGPNPQTPPAAASGRRDWGRWVPPQWLLGLGWAGEG